MESYLIGIGISTILTALKNPVTKRKFRNAFLKVFIGIRTAFADDEAFNSEAIEKTPKQEEINNGNEKII